MNSKSAARGRLPVGPSAARDPPPWKPTMVTEFNFKAMDGGLPRRVRHICESGLRCRTVYLLTLVSLTSMPSLCSSPWMRGAPQRGFSRLLLRISSRTSSGTRGRPRILCTTFQVQSHRKPFLCREITVSGSTITREPRQSLKTSDSHAQKTRSASASFGRIAQPCRTLSS